MGYWSIGVQEGVGEEAGVDIIWGLCQSNNTENQETYAILIVTWFSVLFLHAEFQLLK